MLTTNSPVAVFIGLCAGLLSANAISAQSSASVAYSNRGVLQLLSTLGTPLKTIKTTRPIREFAVSPEAARVAFSTAPLSSYGGQLYILTVATGKIVAIGPVPGVAQTIYSDPEFSRDGRRIAFAVHGSRNGDLVEASGPLAVADVETRSVFALKATEDIGGNGPAYANEPHWSSDSNQLLFSFETGAAIVDVGGVHLRDLTSLMESGATEKWSHALGWVGSGCVAYIAGPTPQDAAKKPLRVLRLKDGRILAADSVISGAHLTDLVAFSPQVQIFKTPSGLGVAADSNKWKLPVASTSGVVARLIPSTPAAGINKACN